MPLRIEILEQIVLPPAVEIIRVLRAEMGEDMERGEPGGEKEEDGDCGDRDGDQFDGGGDDEDTEDGADESPEHSQSGAHQPRDQHPALPLNTPHEISWTKIT